MDPGGDEQLDFGDEEYGGAQKMQYHGGGAIPALAEDEMIGEDDEYDDLYNDVNVGEGLLQLQRSEAPVPSIGMGNGGFQASDMSAREPRKETVGPKDLSMAGGATEGMFGSSAVRGPEQNSGLTVERVPQPNSDTQQRSRLQDVTRDSSSGHLGFQGSVSMSQKLGGDPPNGQGKVASEPMPVMASGVGGSRAVSQVLTNPISLNQMTDMQNPMVNDNHIRSGVDNGNTMLFVGELHWWTTDAEVESVLSQYGKVKEIKFFDERASGKSKGYCSVEFYDSSAAAACKEGMNGHLFNGRACVVAFATPQTIKQMGSSYMNKTQGQAPAQPQGRRPMNDGGGRGNGNNYPSGDGGRNIGRAGGWGRGGPGMPNRGPVGGPARGRGPMGSKNMMGSAPGGAGGITGGAYGQGLANPAFAGPPAGLMHPQGIMGPGFDPSYMGRGAGYGGFSGPAFPGMLPPFPAVNPMGLPGVAPHVNPAFFGRGMAANGMGMMGTAGMDGPPAGMWTDTSMGGWGGEELGQRTRESSHGGEDNASEYGYTEASHEKGMRSSAASREKERGPDRDWSSHSEKRHHEERERDRDRDRDRDRGRYEREHRYREDKDSYRDYRYKDRDVDYEDDWDRGQSSSRSRSRQKTMPEEDHRSRSRDADYGKRRRLSSE